MVRGDIKMARTGGPHFKSGIDRFSTTDPCSSFYVKPDYAVPPPETEVSLEKRQRYMSLSKVKPQLMLKRKPSGEPLKDFGW